MMGDINELVLGVLARAPQWVRQDLLSSDAVIRARAEETYPSGEGRGLIPTAA